MKGYGALVLRLTDEVVEALFVTYDFQLFLDGKMIFDLENSF